MSPQNPNNSLNNGSTLAHSCKKKAKTVLSAGKVKTSVFGMLMVFLSHCILNRFSHTIYWKSPISILGMSGYEIYIFLEKNG